MNIVMRRRVREYLAYRGIAQGKRFTKSFVMDMVGIDDHFGESGAPWDLMKAFGLSAEQITVRARRLVNIK